MRTQRRFWQIFKERWRAEQRSPRVRSETGWRLFTRFAAVVTVAVAWTLGLADRAGEPSAPFVVAAVVLVGALAGWSARLAARARKEGGQRPVWTFPALLVALAAAAFGGGRLGWEWALALGAVLFVGVSAMLWARWMHRMPEE